jgi:hypothetical protein
MKRLILPLLLVLASLFVATIFTTITAVTLASYSKDSQQNKTLVIDQSPLKATAKR